MERGVSRAGRLLFPTILIVTLTACALQRAPRRPIHLDAIQHVVVIYAENRSFDNLYGLFPGASGIADARRPARLSTGSRVPTRSSSSR